MLANVPPDTPACKVAIVRDSPRVVSEPKAALSVLALMWTLMSDGMESNPQEGTMIEPVLRAVASNLYGWNQVIEGRVFEGEEDTYCSIMSFTQCVSPVMSTWCTPCFAQAL